MGVPDPLTPARADHRFIQRIIQSVLGGKVESVPSEYDLVGRVFQKAGGSWVRLFNGSPEDVDLLKRVIRGAQETGRLTPKYKWGA